MNKKMKDLILQVMKNYMFELNNQDTRNKIELDIMNVEGVDHVKFDTCNNYYSQLRGELRVDIIYEKTKKVRFNIKTNGKIEIQKTRPFTLTTKINGLEIRSPIYFGNSMNKEDLIDHINNPIWENIVSIYDWRSYIPQEIKEKWNKLSQMSKVVAYILANESMNRIMGQEQKYYDIQI